MTVHVTVQTCQGAVDTIRAYLTEESALAAQKQWLQEMDIKDDDARQAKADSGTEFLVFEAELKP